MLFSYPAVAASGYEGAVRGGRVALEGVDEAIAFDGIFARGRRRCEGFPCASYRESFRDVEAEGRGVTVGGKIREGKPASGQQQEGAVAINGCRAHAGNRTVFFVGEGAGVGERERDFRPAGDGGCTTVVGNN